MIKDLYADRRQFLNFVKLWSSEAKLLKKYKIHTVHRRGY